MSIPITFQYDGKIYDGFDVGIFTPSDKKKSKKAVVECEKFDTLLRVSYNNIRRTDGNQTEGCVNYWMDTPVYSTQDNGTWYGLNAKLDDVTKGFDTHKELKNSHGVNSVKGFEMEDGTKVYALIYHPEKVGGSL